MTAFPPWSRRIFHPAPTLLIGAMINRCLSAPYKKGRMGHRVNSKVFPPFHRIDSQ
ncbi:hypothetical protein SERLA73DRAFT_175912 [Serpula lacrymans var. lacrymans S7.3]|uniref:Uncharacterized protein n=2 Tax=Serpula lacrymans var. lacrymans TaxID=341189 RepID=F8PJJ2_SERL3|nr:uncharacterized protein SERLADRAFT_458563 [Serpula lacrymans var. lacrymans S7.9]EGO04130.1 hypothetical protein SERLA73DRAFT_175912 [Serpula lacrymans var. lacrymans S7.3]EGO30062.1 hypothetical protein SERLADRAFT_458563 [Serpula lacrymans var. lacrymans S7.9]